MARTRGNQSNEARITWNDDLRLGLDILYDMNLDNTSKAKAFSRAFDEHMRSCGYPVVSWNKLSAQYYERLKPKNARHWAICKTTSEENQARRMVLKAKIDVALKELDLSLTPSETIQSIRNSTTMICTPTLAKIEHSRTSVAGLPKGVRIACAVTPSPSVDTRSFSGPGVPKTPKNRNHSRPIGANIWHQQTPDRGIWVTPAQKEKIDQDLVYPFEDTVHLRVTGPLYRTFNENSRSSLTDYGFVGGLFRFMVSIPPSPPPSVHDPMWHLVGVCSVTIYSS